MPPWRREDVWNFPCHLLEYIQISRNKLLIQFDEPIQYQVLNIYIYVFLGMAMLFFREVFLLVLSYFPLPSHDTELAYGRVCAHTLLSVNNQDFSKTSVSRWTSVVSQNYNLAVVIVVVVVVFHEVHGHGMYVACVCYRHLPVGAPERCELWLLKIL